MFAGRQEPRKGLQVLLRAQEPLPIRGFRRIRRPCRRELDGGEGGEGRILFPGGVERRDRAVTLRERGLAVRLLYARLRVSDEGVDVLGFLSQDALTAELLSAKALVAPSLGGESFGMVLTRAFACATPVVASDISGYRGVMESEAGRLVPPGDPAALADCVVELLGDESRREQLGRSARAIAVERYSWDTIAQRLVEIYEPLTASRRAVAA